MQARRFYLDTQSRAFVGGIDRALPASSTAFFQEDVEGIELYFLEPTGDVQQPYTAVDYSANTVKLAVGLTAPAALQTTWTSLSTAIAATATEVVEGGGGSNAQQTISFSGRQPASGGFSVTLPASSKSISGIDNSNFINIENHGFLNGQIVVIDNITYDGGNWDNTSWFVVDRSVNSFRISRTLGGAPLTVEDYDGNVTRLAVSTAEIPYTATAAEVQQAFVDAGIAVNGVPQIIVTGSYESGFYCTFANALADVDFPVMFVSSTLAASPALSGSLSLNTNEIAALIAAGTNGNLRMEVEVAGSGKRQTYSTSASVADDMIVSASTSPLPVGTAASFALTDGGGGVWVVTVDANGILTTAKQ